jgi:hypothetical protein
VCDFRNIVGVLIDGEVTAVKGTVGGNHSFNFEPDKPGIYHIGASGCGLYYYDGSQWYSDYGEYVEGDFLKPCKFITDGSMDLLIDIKEYKKE